MRYLPFIEKEFPHLARRYRATYANDHKVSDEYTQGLRATMRGLCEQYGVVYGSYGRVTEAAAEARYAGDEQTELPLLG
jgi:hypothetical protein